MTTHDNKLFNDFLAARPAIKIDAIAKHLGVSNSFLTKLRRNEKPMPDRMIEPLREFAKVYGYKLN
jgi:hypothetical protein